MGIGSYPQVVGRSIGKSGLATVAYIYAPTSTVSGVGGGPNDYNSPLTCFGSWVQIAASTAAEYVILGVVGSASSGGTMSTTFEIALRLSVGGAGSEAAVAATIVPLGKASTAATSLPLQAMFAIPPRVAAGSRLAVSIATNQTSGSGTLTNFAAIVCPVSAIEGS